MNQLFWNINRYREVSPKSTINKHSLTNVLNSVPDFRHVDNFAHVFEISHESVAIYLNRSALTFDEGSVLGILLLVAEAVCIFLMDSVGRF